MLHEFIEDLAEQGLMMTDVAMRAVYAAMNQAHENDPPLPRRSHGDDDYSGMTLPDVGSVRESEETQIGDADDGPR